MRPYERIRAANAHEEIAHAGTIALIAEGIAVLLFTCTLVLWCGILTGSL